MLPPIGVLPRHRDAFAAYGEQQKNRAPLAGGVPHGLAQLGAIDVALTQAASVLRAAAEAVDGAPARASLEAVRGARLAEEAAVKMALRHAPRAMCRNARFARVRADLPAFVRQSPAERDLAAHGSILVEQDGGGPMAAVRARTIVGASMAEASWRQWFRAHPLPQVTARALLAQSARLHVVAPHPDDKILGGRARCDNSHGPACRTISGPSQMGKPVIRVRHVGHLHA